MLTIPSSKSIASAVVGLSANNHPQQFAMIHYNLLILVLESLSTSFLQRPFPSFFLSTSAFLEYTPLLKTCKVVIVAVVNRLLTIFHCLIFLKTFKV